MQEKFFSVTAWYIEVLKKEKSVSWEKEIQTFIDSILDGSLGKEFDLLKNINCFYLKKRQKWHEERGEHTDARLCKVLLSNSKYSFIVDKENGKTLSAIAGIPQSMIPEWFCMWAVYGSSMYREIRDVNVKNSANLLSGKKE